MLKKTCSIIFSLLLLVSVAVLPQTSSKINFGDPPVEVIEKYISYAQKNRLGDIENLTLRHPVLARKEINEQQKAHSKFPIFSNERRIINKDQGANLPKYPSDVYLRFIKEDFPYIVFNNNFRLKTIENEIIKNDSAKVSLILENENSTKTSSWVFLLFKDNEAWKIYDITVEENKNSQSLK